MHALKILLATAAVLLPTLASAASLNGAELAITWAIPFAGILLSIALVPLIAPNLWHHHYGKIAVAWGLACVISVRRRTFYCCGRYSHPQQLRRSSDRQCRHSLCGGFCC